jgi:peroxiredoxin Q/BCP
MDLQLGDLAPEFDLEGSDGERHRSADHRGHRAVVLAWFPKASTPG